MTSKIILAAMAAVSVSLSGCGAVLLAGAGTVGARSILEERTTMSALEDAEIQLALNNRYLNHSGRLFHKISTDVQEGRVVLTGAVPTRQDKIDALTMAWEVPGVVSVTDEIQVGEGEGVAGYAEDAWISTRLRTALLTDLDIQSQNYNVETVGRVIHITGLARSPEELNLVLAHAQGISGAQKVVSHVLTIDDPRRVAQAGG